MENTKTSGGRGTFELLVQLITALAVLAGIYLVMVELRQGREISTLEMMHKASITEIEHDSKIYGETLAETLTNACLNEDGLTELDKTRLNYYFQNRMRQVVMAYLSAEIGSFQKGIGFVTEWEFLGLQYINEILSYASGKEWLKNDPFWGDEEIAETSPIVAWAQSQNGIPPYGSVCDVKEGWGNPSV